MSDPSKTPYPASSSTSTTSKSSASSPRRPSLVLNLLESVPNQAIHLLERFLAPNTLLYSPPYNSLREPYFASPTREERAQYPPSQRKQSTSSSTSKGSKTEVAQASLGEEMSEEDGAPLCREADIEKWKLDADEKAKRRRRILH